MKVEDTGINNKIFLPENFTITERGLLSCVFRGNGNQVIIGNNVIINEKVACYFLPQVNMPANGSSIVIGDSTFINGNVIFGANTSNSTIKIGRDCLFSFNIELVTSDGHMIYDIDSGAVMNPGGDIEIGNHVWLCEGVKVLKNTCIPSNCVVATRSLVTKKFREDNVVIGGVPAKVIRKNVNWSREWA